MPMRVAEEEGLMLEWHMEWSSYSGEGGRGGNHRADEGGRGGGPHAGEGGRRVDPHAAVRVAGGGQISGALSTSFSMCNSPLANFPELFFNSAARVHTHLLQSTDAS